MAKISIAELEGGAALCAWFEGIPSFHDAKLRELELRQGAPGRLVAETFLATSDIDAQGYFVLTKHVVVTFTILDLIDVELFDLKEAGIIFELEIDVEDDRTILSFDSSYGVHGRITAKRVVVSFSAGPA